MTTGNCPIKDTEKFSSDVGGNSAIPRRVEPEYSSSPAPVSVFLCSAVSIIDRMNVDFFIFEVVFKIT